MACSKERDNFYRFNSLIVDNGRQAFILLLDYYLSKKRQTFEQFVNNNQHEIFHLCFTSVICCKCPPKCRLKQQNRILNASQLEVLLEKRCSYLAGHQNEFCCSLAKPGISFDVLDVTLAYSLLINFCEDVFWNCCLSDQGKTFENFLNDNKHDIYHLAISSNKRCCICTSGYVIPTSKVYLHDPKGTWATLFSGSSQPCSIHSNGRNGPSSAYPCIAGATPGIVQSMVNTSFREYLLSTFCEGRKNLEIIRDHRNKLAHLVCGSMVDQLYQPLNTATRIAIKHIAHICGKEEEVKRELNELDERPMDHNQFHQHHILLLQCMLKELDLKEEIPVLISEGIQNANQKYKDIRTILERLIAIVNSPTNVSSDETLKVIKSVLVDSENQLGGNIISSNISNPRLQPNVKDLDSCIDVVLTEVSNFPAITVKLKEIHQEVTEEVDVLKHISRDEKSIEIYLKTKVSLMLGDDMQEYVSTVSDFERQLVHLIGIGICQMELDKFNQLLEKVTLYHRNRFMIKLRDDLTRKTQNITRKNFDKIIKVLIPYQYLYAIWKILVLYLSCIVCKNPSHTNDRQFEENYNRSKDIELVQSLFNPTKKSAALFVFLYNRSDLPPMQIFMNNISVSPNLSNHFEGRYNIFPATFRKSYIHKTELFSFLRCSVGKHKCMLFRFELVDKEQSQFHIFLDGCQKLYMRMGVKICVYFKKGDPKGDDKAIWKIVPISEMGPDCYMLATKASKDALLSVGKFGWVYGSTSQPSDKHLWVFNVVHQGNNSI